MGPRVRVLITGALVLVNVASACTSWRVQSLTPQELVAREHPRTIQIRERGGAVYALLSPRVEGDSLTGYVKYPGRRGSEGDSAKAYVDYVNRRIAIGAIDRVAIRKFNALKTALWCVGFPLVALSALVAIDCARHAGPGPACFSVTQ
jgi:hypothetical protein